MLFRSFLLPSYSYLCPGNEQRCRSLGVRAARRCYLRELNIVDGRIVRISISRARFREDNRFLRHRAIFVQTLNGILLATKNVFDDVVSDTLDLTGDPRIGTIANEETNAFVVQSSTISQTAYDA